MSKSNSKQAFATRAIHAGQEPDPQTGAIMTPIYATSTYVQSSPGVHKGYEYSRTQNPTRHALERCVADLESGRYGFAFSSGLAATGTILELIDTGSHVIALDDIYGGSTRLFEKVRRRSAGLDFSFVDMTDIKAVRNAVKSNTRTDLGRNAEQSLVENCRFARRCRHCAISTASSWSPTILLRPRTCSARSSRAATSSCTRSPSF